MTVLLEPLTRTTCPTLMKLFVVMFSVTWDTVVGPERIDGVSALIPRSSPLSGVSLVAIKEVSVVY